MCLRVCLAGPKGPSMVPGAQSELRQTAAYSRDSWIPLGPHCGPSGRSVHNYWLTDVRVGSMNSVMAQGGQSVHKYLIRDLPLGLPCAHCGPKGQPVNQYSNHIKNFATFNILPENNQFCMVNIKLFLAKVSTPEKLLRCGKYHGSPTHTSAYIYIYIYIYIHICIYAHIYIYIYIYIYI